MNPADELMWLNFETRMRGVIRTLLEPVVEISQKDREGMLILEENFNGHDDRLAKVEEAIFNVAVNGEETLFEKMAKKIKQHEVFMKTEIKAITDRQDEKYRDIDAILFEQNQKVKSCMNMKDELLNLENEQRKLTSFVNKYNQGTIDENKVIRDMMAESTDMLQKQLNKHLDRLDDHMPRIGKLEAAAKAQTHRMDTISTSIEKHSKLISQLQETKVNIKDDKKNRRTLEKHLKAIDESHGTLLDQQISIESFVEKYLPLKIQHQMSETIVDCLEKKAKARFIELNTIMCEALRDDIIKDSGHPKLKAKCLDIITRLRVEANVLNAPKTAKAPKVLDIPPKLVNASKYDDDNKEVLGLDENGQIKLSHGPEEIKEMMDKGMVKTYGKRE